MLSIIYNFVITPLLYLIGLIYAILNRLISNPGISVIGVSIAVNFLVLPLYRRADLIQEEERNKQKSMEEWVDHIKKHFKGDEQYMMLSTYYRQQNYKPVQALKSTFSLLLQIPFFIAAYNYLSHLSDLEGMRFLFINDLAKPDGLFTVAGFTVNVLPIAMTLLNCASTAVYTRGLKFKDKIQAYGLAAVFLVLLYDRPAGLVLYWTCGQVFSLVKNIFYKLIKNPRKVFAIVAQIVLIAITAWFIMTGRLVSFKRVAFLIALISLVELALLLPGRGSEHETPDKSASKDSTSRFLLAALLITVSLGALIPSALIGASPAEFIDAVNVENPLRHVLTTASIIGGFFILWGGVYYYVSSPSQRRFIADLYVVVAGVCLVNYFFFGHGLGTITTNLVFEAIPTFTRTQQLVNIVAISAVIAALVVSCRRFGQIVKPLLAMLVIAVAGMTSLNIVAIQDAYASAVKDGPSSDAAGNTTDGSFVMPDNILFASDGSILPLFNLSTEGKNVLIFFMDRAMGTYAPYIFNEKPELAEAFDGFTYYPNTLSYGGLTAYGAPPLYGGYEYVPTKMNERDDELLSDKHNESMMVMPQLFIDAGFEATQIDPPFPNYSYWPPDYSVFNQVEGFRSFYTTGAYVDKLPPEYRGEEKTEENRTRSFVFYSLFKAAPLLLQPTIYDSGNYYSTIVNHAQNLDFLNNYATISLLDQISAVVDDDSNNYIMIHNYMTHSPELLQMPDYTPSPYIHNEGFENPDRFTVDGRTIDMSTDLYLSSYHVNMSTMLRLGEFFDYMRAKGVYDNTRIIIVSDHGYPLQQFEDLVLDRDQDIWNWIRMNVNSFNPLFMVKDFDAHGFTVSDEFMTNGDTPLIALDGIVENPVNPFTGNAMTDEDKTAHDQLVTTSWHHDMNEYHHGTVFDTDDGYWYSVHDNIFDSDNWTLVQEPTE